MSPVNGKRSGYFGKKSTNKNVATSDKIAAVAKGIKVPAGRKPQGYGKPINVPKSNDIKNNQNLNKNAKPRFTHLRSSPKFDKK